MVDFGLLALFAVILALVFLVFHAWRGVKADGERISAQSLEVDSRIERLRSEIDRARDEADDAKRIAIEVQGTHYKTLLRRIDEAEATGLGCLRQAEVLAEKVATLGGRMSAFQRHHGKKAEPDPEPAADPNQVPLFPAAMPPQGNGHVTGHFGRLPGR